MRFSSVIALFYLLVSASVVEANPRREEHRGHLSRGDKNGMIDRLRERHEERKSKLAEMVEERKVKLADHKAGRKLLQDEEHERFSRQVVNFGRKLDQLHSMSESELEEMISHEVEMMERMQDRETEMFRREL